MSSIAGLLLMRASSRHREHARLRLVPDPLAELVALLRAVGSGGYVVVGGLAVRLLAGESNARQTRDVDLVAMDRDDSERLLSHLRSSGSSAQKDDVERTVAEGAQTARLLSNTGGLVEIAEELLDRPASPEELGDLDGFLRALQKEGL
jgi:hypothetical protein